MENILLIDGLNFIWKANIKFGAPNNNSFGPNGEDYTLIYNFFRNLRALIEEFSPFKVFFVLEGHPKFRYDLYSDYKANRIIKTASKQEEMDKFHLSKKEIIRLLKYLPITIAKAKDYECDDTIATLCEDLKDENVVIISNDSDYIQLLQKGYNKLRIFNSIKKEFMKAPDYPYIAWKCLNGDKSDNIPKLLTPSKALKTIMDPLLFNNFLSLEENRSLFNLNKNLIEFKSVPKEDILLEEGIKNLNNLKQEFSNMKFESIVNDKSWAKYVKTFDCILV